MKPRVTLPLIDQETDLRTLVGQLLIVGFSGDGPVPSAETFYREFNVGGFILFSRNIKNSDQLLELNGRLKKMVGIPPFLAIDQEGGAVVRLCDGIQVPPGAMALAATANPHRAFQAGVNTAMDLMPMGFNINFAPVLDIDLPGNPCIGNRSFGDSPIQVSQFGVSYIEGLQSQGMSATAKHFPGLGSAIIDPHLDLPTIDSSEAIFRERDWLPFREAIHHRVDLIMTTHVRVPAMDSREMATFSEVLIEKKLRGELGFDGLVVCDDLEMGGVNEPGGIGSAALKAILAGHDLLLVCHDVDKQRVVHSALVAALEDGRLPSARLRLSLNRIFRLKERHLATRYAQRGQYDPKLSARVASEAIFIDGDKNRLPLSKDRGYDLIQVRLPPLVKVEDGDTGFPGNFLMERLSRAGIHCRSFQLNPDPSAEDLAKLHQFLQPGRIPIFLSYNAHLFPHQRKGIAQTLSSGDESILVALRNPYDLKEFPNCSLRIATLGFHRDNMEALFHLFTGEGGGTGVLPVAL